VSYTVEYSITQVRIMRLSRDASRRERFVCYRRDAAVSRETTGPSDVSLSELQLERGTWTGLFCCSIGRHTILVASLTPLMVGHRSFGNGFFFLFCSFLFGMRVAPFLTGVVISVVI
jgi:hypothetical protein